MFGDSKFQSNLFDLFPCDHWRTYYFIGLVFSHSFVDHAILSILITYLTYNWIDDHFQMAAVVENIRDGLSDIMVIILAHMPHTYRGCFKVIVTTNAAFVVVSIS